MRGLLRFLSNLSLSSTTSRPYNVSRPAGCSLSVSIITGRASRTVRLFSPGVLNAELADGSLAHGPRNNCTLGVHELVSGTSFTGAVGRTSDLDTSFVFASP